MSHVAFVPLTGLRVKEDSLLELGMSMPGLRQRGQAIGELPSLGLLTLAGMTPHDWSCSYHEAGRWDESFVDQLVEKIAQQRPTLVALSALTASIQQAYRLSEQLRRRGIAVVIGGLHVTTCPEEARQHCDAVVAGEGEPVWLDVLHDAQAGELKSLYRAKLPFDLAKAPLPRFELLGHRQRPRMTLQTERGCPLACDFCGASRLLGPFREKPLKNIAQELKALARYDSQPWLELADDNTLVGSRDCHALFELLRASGARWFTEADWRIGERADVLQGLAGAGCVQVLVGIESLVFRYPGMGGKQAELDRIMDSVQAIQQAGVVVNGCFIIGADGETCASLDRLTQFILDSPLAEVQLTLQTPFPGTALYRRLKSQGRLLPQRDWSHYTLFDATYQPDCMSLAELEAGFRTVVTQVFSTDANNRRGQLRRQIWKRRGPLRKKNQEPHDPNVQIAGAAKSSSEIQREG